MSAHAVFLGFYGTPAVLQVAPNGPERSDDTTLFFAAAVDGCEQGMLPFSLWLSSLPEWKAFANPSDGSEGYGKEISKPRWGLGFHSPKQLICGDLRFSSRSQRWGL